MRQFLLSAFLLFSINLLFGQCADPANIYSFNYDGHTYEIVKELQSWDSAAACAIERGGYLVEINSQAENDTIFDRILNGAGISDNYVSIMNGGGIAYVWIGANDASTEGNWIWSSSGINFWTGQGSNGSGNGSAVGNNFVNWGGTSSGGANEPDDYGSGQDYAAIGLTGWPSGTTMLGSAGEWNDIIGSSEIYYIIEYENTNINKAEKSETEIYPNPVDNILNIKQNDFSKAELYDLTGNLVSVYNSKKVNLEEVSSGVYFIRIYDSSDNFINKKVVVY